MKKFLRIFLVLSFLLPIIGLNASSVHAEENNQVQFILHKIVFPEGQIPDETKNTGRLDDAHGELLKDYRGLDGVTFDVYDLTKEFYQLRENGQSVEEAQAKLAEQGPSGQSIAQKETGTIDDQAGTAEFSLNAKSGNQDAVYLFKETAAPENIKEHSRNLVVVLPMYDGDQKLSTIHLYPKNEEEAHQEPPFSKIIPAKHASYEYGSVIPFKLSTVIPADILDYKFFKVVDSADGVLSLNKESLKISIEGKDVSNLFTADLSDHGFELSANQINDLGKYQKKDLTISYEMTLMSHEKVDTAILNTADLITDHEKITKKVDLKTGGKKFRKVDLMDFSKGLENAEFEVLNAKNEYLTQTSSGYSWSRSEDAKNGVKLTSDKEGRFEIAGLPWGAYSLKEIQAPAGYEKSLEKIPFVVTEDSYTSNADVLKVVNKQTTTPPKVDKPNIPGHSRVPKKPRVFRFPQTNDRFNTSFIWIGGVLVIIVVLLGLWKRNKKED
ncbi:SpaH/EbpB family LPXTG-anchored major pilin [Enterococcus devriesei]|uniref:SpaH/EbpB family LPXTG-anchored major pilin n=1 Tax=Enterococcus devriesei TaxID=319970 RepID=UPI0028AD1313|nr:SpaH/EbpB family LPXTG-anchored major pilin [Enterococcus devriesei]